jgi:hypothetical protein
MTIPQMIPISKAARRLGVDRRTLQSWLEDERGLVFTRLGRGVTAVVSEADVEIVAARHSPKRKYAPKYEAA